MNRTSRACSRVLLGVYFTSVARNIMLRKLPLYERSLSGYAYGMPTEWRWANAARGGALGVSPEIWLRREGSSWICFAPGEKGERPAAVVTNIPLGGAACWDPAIKVFVLSCTILSCVAP